jgi:hypothetical protein
LHYHDDVGYEWDPWYLPNLIGIEPYEVMQALLDKRPRWPQAMRGPGGLLYHTVWCRTRTGRAVIVVIAPTTTPFDWIIRGVRDMDEQESAIFAAWETNHG